MLFRFNGASRSILCQEEPYFLELVRYIHLNPLRAGLVKDYEQRYRLASMGLTVDDVAVRVAQLMQMPVEQIWLPGKRRGLVQARSLLCFWSVRELGVSMTALAKKLGISCTAVSQSMIRGEQIARQNNYRLTDNFKC